MMANMTTEELTNAMQSLMISLEETTCTRTANLLIRTIERVEKLRDEKSWN